MQWSPQQAQALTEIAAWHAACMAELEANTRLSRPVFYLAGYAGTGKTTLVKHIAEGIKGKTVFAAFTGKAAMVMRKSGCAGAMTLHSAMYEVKQDTDTGMVTFTWDENGVFSDAALICIDECSMVDAEQGREVLAYKRPVLVMGDPAQLPPVTSDRDRETGMGAGYFTSRNPDVMLTEIHRQARDNPIIALATDVREGRPLRLGDYGRSAVISWRDITASMVLAADQVLVGKNATRGAYNTRIRQLQGIEGHIPVQGDRLVCLKNDRTKGIFNGGIFKVLKTGKPKRGRAANGEINLEVHSLDLPDLASIRVNCLHQCFSGGLADLPWQARRGLQEFDYGYALTVHKAQGSQWSDVLLLDQSGTFREDAKRWLYTGLTRAAERVVVAI